MPKRWARQVADAGHVHALYLVGSTDWSEEIRLQRWPYGLDRDGNPTSQWGD